MSRVGFPVVFCTDSRRRALEATTLPTAPSMQRNPGWIAQPFDVNPYNSGSGSLCDVGDRITDETEGEFKESK